MHYFRMSGSRGYATEHCMSPQARKKVAGRVVWRDVRGLVPLTARQPTALC